jgi:hypothetical protein
MKSIYVHLSPDKFSFSKELNHSNYTYFDLPDYAKYSFEQTEKYLNEKPILLTNQNAVEEFTNEINGFYELCKNGFPSFYRDPFWLTTLLRLYIVYLYVTKNKIEEFIHLEYDNLIYSDLKILQTLPKSIYFTRVGPYCSSAGFVYCNSFEHLAKFINKLEQLLKKGEKTVRTFTQYDHLSEMILLDLIQTHTKNIMDYLPVLPTGIGNDNFDKLQVLFDGASYGQYLGGTNNGHDKGWYGQHHYVGQQISQKNIKAIFESGQPFIIYDNKRIPLQNLHIHSKNLKNFI